MEETHEFQQIDSGSSHTFPQQAGLIRKGGYIMIKGRPCKVSDVSTSKTGKHGHAKAHFVAFDLFTGKKCEELCPTSHNIDVPNVTRNDYSVIDVPDDDDYISLALDDGTMKEDLKYPDDIKLKNDIINKFNDGEEIIVTTICALGEEKIIDYKVSK